MDFWLARTTKGNWRWRLACCCVTRLCAKSLAMLPAIRFSTDLLSHNRQKGWSGSTGSASGETAPGDYDGDYFSVPHTTVQCPGARSGGRPACDISGRDRSDTAAMAGL